MNLSDLQQWIKRYLNPPSDLGHAEVEEDFRRIAPAAPREAIRDGLTETFRSEHTPPFSQLIAALFARSDPPQRAGLLNHLLSALGPSLLSGLASRGGLAELSRLLATRQAQVTPQQAAQVSPDTVQQLASQAEQHDPSIVERASDFYAEHPELVKTLGSAALTILLAKVAERVKSPP